MNALQRLQETQETLQGVADRLRLNYAGLTLPELAGVVATELVKIHAQLVDKSVALADMERQRDEARRELATEGAAMADALGKVKAIIEAQGVPVGDYWADIPLAVDRCLAEADTKPRERVETNAESEQERQRLEKAHAAWEREFAERKIDLPVAHQHRGRLLEMLRERDAELAKLRANASADETELTGLTLEAARRRLEVVDLGAFVEFLRERGRVFEAEIATLRARAEKAEFDLAMIRVEADNHHTEACEMGQIAKEQRARAEKAERELEAAKDKVAEILSEMELDAQRTLLASLNEIGNGIQHRQDFYEYEAEKSEDNRIAAIDRTEERDKAIERAIKAERELARFQRADVGEVVKGIEAALFSDQSASMLRDGQRTLLSIVRQQAAEIERLKATKPQYKLELPEGDHRRLVVHWSDWENGKLHLCVAIKGEPSLSAIRERVEKLPVFAPIPLDGTRFVIRSEVLSALGVVKDSLTTERKPVCSHCNDTHRIGIRWCSRCPRPCKEKCHDGNGYCRQTPCPCDCHKVASEAKS